MSSEAKSLVSDELERAWAWREQQGFFSDPHSPVRIFHGPTESHKDFSSVLVDRFGNHYWITERTVDEVTERKVSEKKVTKKKLEEGIKHITHGLDWKAVLEKFLCSKGAQSAVILGRPKGKIPAEPEVFFGEPPSEGWVASENALRFLIRFTGTRHPGLFLDHAPLREWLCANSQGERVLNAFAYTGSLSCAAGVGGAEKVVTLDLSRPSIQWAKENWKLNSLAETAADWWVEDVFSALPKIARKIKESKEQFFDSVILDPPSFSRGKKGNFSTARDLPRLHEIAFRLIRPGGRLITSINSANISKARFLSEIQSGAKSAGVKFEIEQTLGQPATFPVRDDHPEDAYLKCVVLRVSS